MEWRPKPLVCLLEKVRHLQGFPFVVFTSLEPELDGAKEKRGGAPWACLLSQLLKEGPASPLTVPSQQTWAQGGATCESDFVHGDNLLSSPPHPPVFFLFLFFNFASAGGCGNSKPHHVRNMLKQLEVSLFRYLKGCHVEQALDVLNSFRGFT